MDGPVLRPMTTLCPECGVTQATPKPDTQVVSDTEMLTEAERDLVQKLGSCWVDYSAIVGRGPSRAADCNEFVARIHDLQHAVMSQAAARAYPTEFRLLGESFHAEETA